jgi:geranylgeranyl diphosphate synthase type II
MRKADDYRELTEKALIPALNSLGTIPQPLPEAMTYSMTAGGKRIRPVLLLATCEMAGGDIDTAMPYACALEMIHTYSLIHDDLPAMDNDEYRRGRRTAHIVYGDGMAVLSGDGLLNYAFETALKAFDAAENREETDRVIRALKILSSNAGVYGMVGGQCADLEAEKKPASEAPILYIHKHKTACMIESGFTIGAVLAGAPEEDIRLLDTIGEDVGIAFQIRDDILDVTGDSAVMGKATGMDAKDEKATYVSVYGMEASEKEAERRTKEAVSLFDRLTAENPFLRELVLSLLTRQA